MKIAKSAVASAALELFSGLAYSVLHGSDFAPGKLLAEGASYEEAALAKRLRRALASKSQSGGSH
jgi:hypothetical protein